MLAVDVGRAGERRRPAHAARTYLEVALAIDTPSASAAARTVGARADALAPRVVHAAAGDRNCTRSSCRPRHMPRFGVYLLPPGQPSLRWMGGTMLSSGRLRGTFLHSHPTHLEVAWVVAASPAEIGLETAEFQRAGIAAMPLAPAGAPGSGAAELAAARARLKLLVVRTGSCSASSRRPARRLAGSDMTAAPNCPPRTRRRLAASRPPSGPAATDAHLARARAAALWSCDGDPLLFAEANYMHTSFIMWLSLDDPPSRIGRNSSTAPT